MTIVYGLQPPVEGEMWVDGKPYRPRSPLDAIAHGIGMVHQHFMLVEPFTVLENLVLGLEPGSPLRITLEEARTRAEALMEELGCRVPLAERVEKLRVGLRERVEFLEAGDRR
ncbi:heme ABC transporter ATP-binding protein, partial [Shewanella sp. C31]|nr:heme ABC transporter ATP-binding protein [Shewanella electrica]